MSIKKKFLNGISAAGVPCSSTSGSAQLTGGKIAVSTNNVFRASMAFEFKDMNPSSGTAFVICLS